MQLGLARAITANGIDVHAGLDHPGSEDRRIGLVCSDGGDDVGAANGFGRALADRDLQAHADKVGRELGTGRSVVVEEPQLADAHQVAKGDRLELALRAVADQRHAAAARPRQALRGQRRHRRGTDRGGDRQLGQQPRRAGGHIGEHAECHHRRQAQPVVGGVAVDVLEGELRGVGNRHQLDHADLGMACDASRLVEILPAQKVGFDARRHAADTGRQALAADDANDVIGAEKEGAGKAVGLHGGHPAAMAASLCARPGKRKPRVCCALPARLTICQGWLAKCQVTRSRPHQRRPVGVSI